MNLANKPPSQMTAWEVRQRMHELNGIKPPLLNAPKHEQQEYFEACFLTMGMKIYGDKDKAHKFMEEHIYNTGS